VAFLTPSVKSTDLQQEPQDKTQTNTYHFARTFASTHDCPAINTPHIPPTSFQPRVVHKKMYKPPPSPSFKPPTTRLSSKLPKISALSLSPPEDPSPPPVPEPTPSPPVVEVTSAKKEDKEDKEFPDDDIYKLDDEGWARVAKNGGIEEMFKLGEGISGAVSKCRLRKSGQVFAIKVPLHPPPLSPSLPIPSPRRLPSPFSRLSVAFNCVILIELTFARLLRPSPPPTNISSAN